MESGRPNDCSIMAMRQKRNGIAPFRRNRIHSDSPRRPPLSRCGVGGFRYIEGIDSMTDDRGRWFRVYPRSIEDHPKFRPLNGVELGAWTALRSAAELRDRAMFVDRDEAVLILKRRRIARPATVLDSLIRRRLFDEDDQGRIHVHDRDDHDRSELSPEQQTHRRNHRRSEPTEGCPFCLIERWDRSIGAYGGWTPVDVGGDVDYSTSVDGGLPQHAEPAPANSQQPAAPATDSTPLTLIDNDEPDGYLEACRLLTYFPKNDEFREEMTALDQEFGAEQVIDVLGQVYSQAVLGGKKLKPFELKNAALSVLMERRHRHEKAVAAAKSKKVQRAMADDVARQEAEAWQQCASCGKYRRVHGKDHEFEVAA